MIFTIVWYDNPISPFISFPFKNLVLVLWKKEKAA